MYRMKYKIFYENREIAGERWHSFGDAPAFISRPEDAERIIKHWSHSGWRYELMGISQVVPANLPRDMWTYYEGEVIVHTTADTRMLH